MDQYAQMDERTGERGQVCGILSDRGEGYNSHPSIRAFIAGPSSLKLSLRAEHVQAFVEIE